MIFRIVTASFLQVEEKNLSTGHGGRTLKVVGARRNTVISKSWLHERREILQKIKDQVHLYLGPETADITRYAQAYKKDLARPWEASGWGDIDVAFQQVAVVFGGDFHPFSQAQRTHLRLLRKVVQERDLVLVLECLFWEDQAFVDAFLREEIDEDTFLEKTQWESRWGFPWAHYKPLLDFARRNGVPVLALNQPVDERTGLTLQARDDFAGQCLVDSMLARPESLHYVIYGDLHVASSHLPQSFQRQWGRRPPVEMATLYLNSESIYFELAEQGLESDTEVVKFSDREFCILSSPPWVKWHSYLMYLEENFDVELELDDDGLDDEEAWDFQVDHTDHVSDLVKMISAAFALQIDANAIEVYSMKDPQALVATKRALSKDEYELAHSLIQNDRSYYIPQQGFFYLSKATVNHAATLAGQYIHAVLSGRKTMLWNFPDDFIGFIWVEAMAFLLSKFVNPKRKAQSMGDLKKQLEAFDKEDRGREPLLLALDQKMLELLQVYAGQKRSQAYQPRDKSSYALAAKFIGEILGNRYFVLYERKILDIDNIRALLQEDVSSDQFVRFYYDQLKKLDRLEVEGKQ